MYTIKRIGLKIKKIQSKFLVTLPFDVSKFSLPREEAELSLRMSRICSENFVSIVPKSRATVSILANRAKTSTVEMNDKQTDKEKEHV